MSHELRTPLNAIMGFSDVMRQRIFGELPGRYAEYADLIHDAGAHLLDLINDVLDMSKIEAARYELSIERMDAREPVQAALRLMRLQADDAGIQLRGGLPATPLHIRADRRALKQITLNLVSNALKFTPKGGLVTVDLQSRVSVLELSVTDTGMGIAAEDLLRLGRPFEQAGDATQQSRGTGLGLSLVRAFAELHGGEMLIESRLGEGTAVTVRLPIAEGGSAPLPSDTGERLAEEAVSADA
jgi:cell cycle sensor histidine kinase DivJ